MPKKILICLVGLPACGKSTLSSHLLGMNLPFHTSHCCYDDHIPRVDHSHDPQAWRAARLAINRKLVGVLSGDMSHDGFLRHSQHSSAENCDHVLLLDDNFYLRGMRKEIYHIAQKLRCVFGQIVFPVSNSLAVANNKLRGNSSVTEETIKKMSGEIEMPSEAWEKHFCYMKEVSEFTVDTVHIRSKTVLDFINVLRNAEPETDPMIQSEMKEKERLKTLHDRVQQADIALRKLVSEKIKSDRSSGLKLPYKHYADSKDKVLEQLRLEKIAYSCSDEVLIEMFEKFMT